jgi:acyl carrier protein
MIPAYIIQIPEMPLLTNGKVNRKALPDSDVNLKSECVSPTNEVEEKLVDIWSVELNLPKEHISTNRSIFEMGGHSLNILQLINKINKYYNTKISIKEIFERKTIENIADYLITTNQLQLEENQNDKSIEITI